ncbi:hypothetical protein C5Y97_24630 [Blastopirellula marina]|uniref:Uncharacterized protein n=1 Tax=Blastopirellula marina TaxID=124 RepID=A0A2S8F9X0_9BACT|nr:hypothetical protein C5Y98_24615 [Blastopirellula marina]PTL42218.1 hypothetical protein C5Y97_24630 [Blastopirellula marina]
MSKEYASCDQQRGIKQMADLMPRSEQKKSNAEDRSQRNSDQWRGFPPRELGQSVANAKCLTDVKLTLLSEAARSNVDLDNLVRPAIRSLK